MTGITATNDHHRALASWVWRNTHYAHGEEGAENLWGKGFTKGGDLRTREYWTGLFAHGFGLCGTTHSQWTAEMEYLLGHNRARGVGAAGHNSFEVFLTGGPYGAGQWTLLDHDLSTVIFDSSRQRLLSLAEVKRDPKRWTDRNYLPSRQNGWLPCGLHPGDGSSFTEFNVAEYLAGYASVPPIAHLRAGETMRRYFEPGLDNGKTFVFWGRNYQTGGIPGPERSLTWVNQPEAMYRSNKGAGHRPGQMRYGNVVYTYKPDFSDNSYKEGVVDESDSHVTFEFYTPYIIAAAPSSPSPWGIYDRGCHSGLILNGRAECPVSISVDQGTTWHTTKTFSDGLDLTDHVKGHRQYLLRFDAPAKALKDSGLVIRTVCQGNPNIFPRLKDQGTSVHFESTRCAVLSAGPNLDQARAHVAAGAFDSSSVTLRLNPPRATSPLTVYASAHIASGNPPDPKVTYQIDYSTDSGKTWEPMVRDWTIPRQGEQPPDFWSQSFCYGSANINHKAAHILVRFTNSGNRQIRRAEAHLVYRPGPDVPTRVTYHWTDARGPQTQSHIFQPGTNNPPWQLATAAKTKTHWVELEPVHLHDFR